MGFDKVKGMKTRRLQRLHFSSTPSCFKMAISCPQWQRASESVVHGDDMLVSRAIWMLKKVIFYF
jgi:hypothetical protein